MTSHILILILRPLGRWGIMLAELKRVSALGQFMDVTGSIRAEWLNQEEDEELRLLATLCEELGPSHLYSKYANRKTWRRESDFWNSDDKTLQKHLKTMADKKLLKIIGQAGRLDIPILYASNNKSALHITDRLQLQRNTPVTPIMNFHRHEEGTTYRLQLRINGQLIENISTHHVTVLTYHPGVFILDKQIFFMDEGFSGQLLLPFVNKPAVAIPRHMENDYFRRFILKNVAKVDINAEGFDIEDLKTSPVPTISIETSIGGQYLLSLHFKYGTDSFAPDSRMPGRVRLKEDEAGFHFIRQLRNPQQEQHFLHLLRQTGTEVTPSGIIHYPSLEAMVHWLRIHGTSLRQQGFDVVQPSDHVYYIGPLNIEQNETWHGDWLQTNISVVLDNGRLRIPFSDLRDTILRGEQEYMLPTGERLVIPEEWLARYADLLLIGTTKDKGFLRHRSQIKIKDIDTDSANKDAVTPNQLFISSERSWKGLKKLKATLRPYQQVGFEWLWHHFEARTGCCLSDEMGLGKTIQTIALLLEYKERAKTVKPPQTGFLFTEEEMSGNPDSDTPQDTSMEYHTSLVVAPASVVHNWHNELSRFAPTMLVCNYTGDISKRQEKRLNLMRWDIVLTTYRTLLNDIDYLSRLQFGVVVFDESQTFKTYTSLIHQAVVNLKAMHHIALSGTPVENNLNELWSLMNVLNPELLGDISSFQRAFVSPIARRMEQERAKLLKQLITPYFLKRTKEEVLTDLPERQDEVVVCPMTETQASLYATELSRARNEWMDVHIPESYKQMNMLAAIQRLRQIANGEGKMNVVFDYLENLRETLHKVLIFSEFVSLLERVGDQMHKRGWTYEILTGATQHREQVIAHFQQKADCQFFLISLKAGGVGINLTAADYVFLLDPWWNQAAEEQAIARSHRIGQRHPVFVYRFVTENTLEQQILTLQERKQSLIDSVMPFVCKE